MKHVTVYFVPEPGAFYMNRRRRQGQRMQPTETVTGRLETTSDETELKASAARVTTHGPPPEDGYPNVRESVHYEEVPEINASATRVTTHGPPPKDGYPNVRESTHYHDLP